MSDKALPGPGASKSPVKKAGRNTPQIKIGLLKALFRFMGDKRAPLAGKLFVVAALVYVVSPADIIPDVVPIIGWLDDIGVIGVAMAYLTSVLGPYRDGTALLEDSETKELPR